MSTPTSVREDQHAPRPARGAIDRFFKITERGSTIGTEIRGGLVTFFAMAYIIVLNPLIIGTVQDGTGQFLGGGDAPDFGKIAAATALVAGVMTIAMGVFANFPLGLAAGLGLNAVVAYSIASLPGVTWADAMGLVVIEGLIILLLGHRVPRGGLPCGPGRAEDGHQRGHRPLHRAHRPRQRGLRHRGQRHAPRARQPRHVADPRVRGRPRADDRAVGPQGQGRAARRDPHGDRARRRAGEHPAHRSQGSDGSNPNGFNLNAPTFDGVAQVPDFGLLGQFLLGSFQNIATVTVILLVFSLLLADFFDTMGTMVAVGAEARLNDAEGVPPRSRAILVVDSIAAAAGGAGSVSSNTSFVESTTVAGEGARTGLASVVTGIAFLLATFLSPLVALVPYEAAAPALVFVGFLMMTQIAGISWKNVEIAIPAFLTIIVMPFTYSIADGIGAGFLAFVVIKLALGKIRAIHPLMWVASAMFLVYFLLGPIREALGL